MYKISVPVMNENVTRCSPERVYEQIKKLDGERVFLALGQYKTDRKEREEDFRTLRENCRFFKSKGLEVGVWIWAFMLNGNHFTPMKSLKGTVFPENMCPLDEDFVRFAEGYASDMAKSGVDIIMYDDDFRYGFLGDAPGCVCENHLKLIGEILGEEVTEELIRENVYNGGKNRYRDAYLKANGEAFRRFAKRMRNAADKINPEIRMGQCACLNSWDIDGIKAEELSGILAGNTKPFFRLIGAPYWGALGAWGNSLQDSVELSRMECSWTKDRSIEIFSEGDVYPRPRTHVPASFLEGFDTALRFSGCTDGILKYAMDYTSDTDYETGYREYHIRNRELYRKIEKMSEGKTSVGVRVFEFPEKLSDAVFTEEENIDYMFFSLAARMLSYNSIPTVYEGQGITGAVFGENARHLTENDFLKGLILDIKALEILAEKGIDTGVISFGEKITAGAYESFLCNGNRINAMKANIRDITLSENAEILSFTEKDGRRIPLSFRYENAKGQKFFVLNIIPDINNPSVLRHYERNRQLRENILWLSGERLPAEIGKSPALYMQCKENEDSLSVGLWNFFPDIVFSPVIDLSDNFSEIECVGCEGKLQGNKVSLSDVPAYGFSGFTVKKGRIR